MPHDRKGRLIEVGDVVKGKGYNIKHEIIGNAVHITPDSTTCNIQIAVAKVLSVNSGSVGLVHCSQVIVPSLEYGQCDAFEIILKHDGTAPTE